MTITADYTVYGGRYHPSSSTFSRPPQVWRSGTWCGKHIRFAEEELPEEPISSDLGIETQTPTTTAEFLATKPETEVIQKFLETYLDATTYEALGDISVYPQPMVTAMLRGFAEKIDAALTAATKPKKKTTRTKDKDWEIEVLNPDDPQGKDYDYYLGDADIAEGVVTYKDQSAPKGSDPVIGATGKPVKKRRIKAVRKEGPFLSTDTCSACITWDRAKGSKVLKAAGIGGSFVMCCGTTTEDGATYCDAHTKKSNTRNFWEGKYKRGGMSRVGGMSYAKFLVEECGENAVGGGVDKDYCVGKGAKW
jgi:hypothetical protein